MVDVSRSCCGGGVTRRQTIADERRSQLIHLRYARYVAVAAVIRRAAPAGSSPSTTHAATDVVVFLSRGRLNVRRSREPNVLVTSQRKKRVRNPITRSCSAEIAVCTHAVRPLHNTKLIVSPTCGSAAWRRAIDSSQQTFVRYRRHRRYTRPRRHGRKEADRKQHVPGPPGPTTPSNL